MSFPQQRDAPLVFSEDGVNAFNKLNFTDLVNLAISRVLNAPLANHDEFAFAVDKLEMMLVGDLPKDYDERLRSELTGVEDPQKRVRVKFRLLLEVVKKKTPREVEGSI